MIFFQALRGSSSSFGIVTVIHAATFAAPASTMSEKSKKTYKG